MSEQTIASVTIIDRGTFDDTSDQQKQGNIYFVREGTSGTNTMLSLYFENNKQCDILDISDSFISTSSIPDKYKIKGKILLAKNNEDIMYQAFMWNGTEFINCLGTVNNVIVCDGLPNIFNAVKNFVYIDISSSGIFVFDGYNYQDIISSNTYATNQYLNQLYYELVDMINNIQPSGSNMIGNAVGVTRGTMLMHVGILQYPLLQGTIPVVQGGWEGAIGGTIWHYGIERETWGACRCSSDKLYKIPSGKTATISVSNSDLSIYYRAANEWQIITEISGWLGNPCTIDNSTGESDMYVGLIYGNDTEPITPSDVGTVMAVLE